jgi:predicted Fe-Mo cluster-binding NifX family protein
MIFFIFYLGVVTMKFAIPMAEGKLAIHFGHCREFAFVNVEDNKVGSTEVVEPPPHEPGVLPKWLSDQGAEIVIAGGMGARAVGLLEQAGVKVVIGAPQEAPEELVKQYLAGTLQTGQNLCDN